MYIHPASMAPFLVQHRLALEFNSGYVTPGFPASVAFPNPTAIRNECAASTGWVTDPATLPGGIAAATKVRVRALKALLPGVFDAYAYKVNLKVLDASPVTGVAWPLNTILPDWGDFYADELVGQSNATNGWINNNYVPQTHVSFGIGDRIMLTRATARINKVSLNLDGVTADNSVNSVLSGGTVGYALLPSYSAPSGVTGSGPITVHDILPIGISYVGGTAKVGGTAFEPSITICTAANAPVEGCTVAGQQALTWSMGNYFYNQAIPEIKFIANVSLSVANGASLVNTAVVSASNDASSLGQRSSSKTVSASLPSQFLITKSVSPAQIERNATFTYTITYLNNGGLAVNMPDVIDILPTIGDGTGTWAGVAEGRSPASSYNGSRVLQSVTASTPAGIMLYVTNAPGASIDKSPGVASNANPGVGASIWCQATIVAGVVTVAGGQPAGCSGTNAANLTAVRIRDNDTSYPASDGSRSINLLFSTSGNILGNVYTNDAGGFAVANLVLPVISNDSSIPVVASTIGDRVWEDLNGNGVQDPSDLGINSVTEALNKSPRRATPVQYS
jgi:uncharacterized repeat protein (TIGR01451 family)